MEGIVHVLRLLCDLNSNSSGVYYVRAYKLLQNMLIVVRSPSTEWVCGSCRHRLVLVVCSRLGTVRQHPNHSFESTFKSCICPRKVMMMELRVFCRWLAD